MSSLALRVLTLAFVMCGLLAGCSSDEAATGEARSDVRSHIPDFPNNTITAYVRFMQWNLDNFKLFPEAQRRFGEECERAGVTDCRVHGLVLDPETHSHPSNFPTPDGSEFLAGLNSTHFAFIVSSGVGSQFGDPSPRGTFKGVEVHDGDLVTLSYDDGDWVMHEPMNTNSHKVTFYLRDVKTFEVVRQASRLQCIYNNDGVVYSVETSPMLNLRGRGPGEFLRVNTCDVDEPGSLCTSAFGTAEFDELEPSGAGFVVRGDDSHVDMISRQLLQNAYHAAGIDYFDRRVEMLNRHPHRSGSELHSKVVLTSNVRYEELPVEPIYDRDDRTANLPPNATFSWNIRLYDAPETDPALTGTVDLHCSIWEP